jgi:hypothetical protein
MGRRHQGDTKTFDELDAAEQARSISASIMDLENAIANHVSHGKGTSAKCIAQIERLLERLKVKYP